MTRLPSTAARAARRAVAEQERPDLPVPLTAATVLGFQGYRAYPSVSLLLNTRPGAELDPADRARLRALAGDARRRLNASSEGGHPEPGPGRRVTDLLAALDALVDNVHGPVDRAIALFASAARLARFDLPVEVVDRCVIDPTFATRDLVRALHRTPRHVVLLLASDRARLLDAARGTLAPVSHGFPRRDPGHRRGTPARESFLREVDKSLGAYLQLHPAPLVIAAAQPTLSTFRQLSRNTRRLAGTLTGHHLDTPVDELQIRIRPVIEDYLLSRQAEALNLLTQRDNQRRAVHGLARAWLAARWERPEMLAVEQGYFQPARLTAGGDTLVEVDEVDELGDPEVLDDAVDELIEAVLGRGGWVALLPDGTLPADTRVAVTLHTRSQHP
jgi:Bacterial archaeo-eukaryotic release factor family 3